MRMAWVKFCSAISTVSWRWSLSCLMTSMVRLTRSRARRRRGCERGALGPHHPRAPERQHLLLAAGEAAGELRAALLEPRKGLVAALQVAVHRHARGVAGGGGQQAPLP